MANQFALHKYSYHQISINWPKNIVNNGTGFFVRRSERLFFITAGHAFSGWNAMQLLQNDDFPLQTELILRTYKKDTIEPMSIDLRTFRAAQYKINIANQPDIAIIELNPAVHNNYRIFSIERFMDLQHQPDQSPMQIFGYGRQFPPGTSLREVIKESPMEGNLSFISDFALNPNMYFEAITDSGNVVQGCSGAPIFSILNDGKDCSFTGILVGGEPGNKPNPKLLILKADVVSAMIDTMVSLPPNLTVLYPSILQEWIRNNGL